MGTLQLRDWFSEFFTLREAEREARALAERHASLARALTLANQKREAAEKLWPRGSAAEALKLARAALESVSSSLVESVGKTSAPVAWMERAQSLAAGASARLTEVPELEADVVPAHEEAFQEMIGALLAIEEQAGHFRGGPAGVAQLRARRIVTSTIVGALGIVLLAWLLHAPAFSAATASGFLDQSNVPDKAIDGDPKTFWLPPEGQTGWIELTLGRPRSVKALRIAVGNAPWGDRGTKDARIEAFRRGALVKGVDVTLPQPSKGDAAWTQVALGAPECDHIRFTPKSFYQLGPSLAEIELE